MWTLEADEEPTNGPDEPFTDDILISDSAGALPVGPYFEKPAKQRRKHCRYVRDDIQAGVADNRLLSRKRFSPVRLIDVSQVGASIGYAKKMKCGERFELALSFEDGQSFRLRCMIANRRPGYDDMIYGLKFEKANHEYEEHLLKTGLKIKLKKFTVEA